MHPRGAACAGSETSRPEEESVRVAAESERLEDRAPCLKAAITSMDALGRRSDDDDDEPVNLTWESRCEQALAEVDLEKHLAFPSQCAALVGEDQPLCPDLPELDLSELDVSDLDADGFLGGLKWYSDQSEIISAQYGNEASNLFEKIDEENEANLLAVLTETLDSIPVDEDGLPSFEALADGDVTNASDQSCPSSPDGSPRTPEPDEPSLLKKLLLAPANSQLSYNQYPGGKAQNHAASSNHRIRPPPAVVKTESPWNGKARGVSSQQNRPLRRPCTELLKYLTATDDILLHTKANDVKGSWGAAPARDKSSLGPGASSSSSSSSPSSSSTSSFSSLSSTCSSSTAASKKKSAAPPPPPPQPPQQHHHQRAKPTTLPLPLTPESPNDHKGSSPFESKTIECTLSVEIAGTPGLTPPTTPPHKASQETPFKVSLKTKLSSCSSSALACKRARLVELGPGPNRKGPEQTELYAQLSKASTVLPYPVTRQTTGSGLEGHRSASNPKRVPPRGVGDHDYCQASASAKKNGDSAAGAMTATGATAASVHSGEPGAVGNQHVGCKDSATPPSSSPSSSSCPLAQRQSFASTTGEEAHVRGLGKESLSQNSQVPLQQDSSSVLSRKLLRDQEIRAELNKHFGHPLQALYSQGEEEREPGGKANKVGPRQSLKEEEIDSQRPPGSGYLHSGLLSLHDELELGEGRESRFLYPWEGTPLDLLFDCPPCSPSCSPPLSCSPSRGSVSPPSSLLLSPGRPRRRTDGRSRSRSRSRSGSRSSSSGHRRRSLSSSPYRRPSSWCHNNNESSTFRSRSHKSPHPHSRSPPSRRSRYDSYEEYQHERLKREEYLRDYEKKEFERAEQRDRQRQKAIGERRVVYVGRLRSDCTRTELKRRFEVFGEIEECAVNLRDDGDNFGFITYRYTCDALAALDNGHTLRRSNEPRFELCFGGQKQFCKSHYTDLDSHSDDFDPASTKSKYDSLDFDSLLREAQRSLRR
ncbi:peroxisome proliferator-activated receptor gamma coactivator 1-alpha isoform X7 [Festucalex cinctus]